MSVPHTGKIVAQIDGRRCTFNGDTWSSDDRLLADALNQATRFVPKMHHTIQEIFAAVIRRARLTGSARIISAANDEWTEPLPEGAVD